MRTLDPNGVAIVAAILLHGGHVVGADDDARETIAVKRAISILGVAHDQIELGYGQRPDDPAAGSRRKKAEA
jgi:hypothetical protein